MVQWGEFLTGVHGPHGVCHLGHNHCMGTHLLGYTYTAAGSEVVCSRITQVTEAPDARGLTALTVSSCSHTVTGSSAQQVTGAGLAEGEGGEKGEKHG